MQVLLAISLICVVALIWVTLAIARHIGATRITNRWTSDDIPSIVPHSNPYPAAQQKTTQLRPRDFRQELIAATQVDFHVRQSDLRQSARDISANKGWAMPTEPQKPRLLTREQAVPSTATQGRTETSRTQHHSRRGVMQRLDLEYFNKDSGDLSDPYELSRTNTKTSTNTSKRMKRSRY